MSPGFGATVIDGRDDVARDLALVERVRARPSRSCAASPRMPDCCSDRPDGAAGCRRAVEEIRAGARLHEMRLRRRSVVASRGDTAKSAFGKRDRRREQRAPMAACRGACAPRRAAPRVPGTPTERPPTTAAKKRQRLAVAHRESDRAVPRQARSRGRRRQRAVPPAVVNEHERAAADARAIAARRD